MEPKSLLVKSIALFVFTFITAFTFAQGTGTVRGFVKDKDNGEPVIFGSVYLDGTSHGTSTDVNGYYSLSKIPVGSYTLVVSSVEFEEYRLEIQIEKNIISNKNIQVSHAAIELKGAEISAEQQVRETQVRMSVETISPKDIKKVPSFGGQADIVQVIQVLPGVVSTGDQGGQLYIRGGSPVQNKILLDGMIVYNAFHSIGLFSVFDTDVISNADIYTGGFNAEFGGRISSIMDISTKDGNKKRISGKIGASPFGAKVMLEGPILKMNEKGGGISFIVSGKTSYLEESSKTLYTYIDTAGLPFNYTDIYGKVSFNGASGSKVNLFGFNFTDDVRYQAISNLSWRNSGGGGNFLVIPSGSPVLISGNFANSGYSILLEEEGVADRESSIKGFNFGLDFKLINGENDLKYGVEVVGFNTNYKTFNPLGIKIEQEENTTEIGMYVSYKITAGRLIIEPGIRGQYYGSLSKFSPEPRLGAKFKVNERLRLKLAGGMYSQNLISLNSDRDVVNLFYGFLAGPENLQEELILEDGTVEEITHPLQLANHAILGFEFDINEKFNLNVEGYYKKFKQVTNRNRNKLFPDTPEFNDKPETQTKDFIVEAGNAKGVDFVLKFEDKHTSVWLVYSLGDVNRWDGFNWYDPVFDRTHNVNFVFAHNFGEDHSWGVNARWNYGSGLPFTQVQGHFQPLPVDGDNYLTDNPDYIGTQYAGLNEGRLPNYHRLDLNVSKALKFKNRVKMDINLGVTNVYSQENIFYVNALTAEEVYQLPILPSLGVDVSF